MKVNKQEIKYKLIGMAGKIVIDLLFGSLRIEEKGREEIASIISSGKYMIAVWHSRLLMVSYLFKGVGGIALVSQSKDGEIATRIVENQGNSAVRGSSTRGGRAALSKMAAMLKKGNRPGLITPDGPQGPIFKVQPGIIMLAKRMGYTILPVAYSGKKIKIFNSWDRFILPVPFSRCRVVYGEPLYVAENANMAEMRKAIATLETELGRITSEVDEYFGHNIK